MHLVRQLVVAVIVQLLAAACPAGATPLDDYVQRPDAHFYWEEYHQASGLLAHYYFLHLVSQQWLDADQVDHPVWSHEIKIGQPSTLLCGDRVKQEHTALLIVSGGKNAPDGRLSKDLPFLLAGAIANTFCRTVIELRQVPNQPLRFRDEDFPRTEDAIIAYSADKFLKADTGDWPVQMAMVKSVVAAMTAVQEFARRSGKIPRIDGFALLGTSKRGWTIWLTAAEDPRVRAIIPVSIDMLDLGKQFPHQFAAYGGFGPALRDYVEFNLAARMRGARGQALLGIVDPIRYRDRLTLPKLLINSAGDEFFTSDASRFYYAKLLGDNRLRYTVNTNHRQGDNGFRYELVVQARNWLDDVLNGHEPPALRWTLGDDGLLTVTPSTRPLKVRLWTADNPTARDFRLDTIGPTWNATELQTDADGRYHVQLRAPARGWRAQLVEATFGPKSREQTYTTEVFIRPDTLPYTPTFSTRP